MLTLLIGALIGLVVGHAITGRIAKVRFNRFLEQQSREFLLMDRSKLMDPRPMQLVDDKPTCTVCGSIQAMSAEVLLSMNSISLWSNSRVIAHTRSTEYHPSDDSRAEYIYIWYDFDHVKEIPNETRQKVVDWLTSIDTGSSCVEWKDGNYLKVYGPIVRKNATKEWMNCANLATIETLKRFVNPDLILSVPSEELATVLAG